MPTIKSFIDLSLGMWNDRCNTLHGVDEKEQKVKTRQRILKQVEHVYKNKGKDADEFQHMSTSNILVLKQRSTTYLLKWMEIFNIAKAASLYRKKSSRDKSFPVGIREEGEQQDPITRATVAIVENKDLKPHPIQVR